MNEMDINGKKLKIPSFFQIYNYGGGNGDKDREIVYSEFTDDIPALVNYYYINNKKYPHKFQSPYFNDLSIYDRKNYGIADIFNYIRSELITNRNYKSNEYNEVEFDFNKKIFLLDSGAANIVQQIAEEFNYDFNTTRFEERMVKEMQEYFDFAERYKFDIVVGFDLGGKYTFKNDENNNTEWINFYNRIDKEKINIRLLEESINYLKTKCSYYPKVLATIHGKTPDNYKEYTEKVLQVEKEKEYKFWGFALGGVANSRTVDSSWFDGIDFKKTGKGLAKDTVAPARAIKIVRSLVDSRPIHALGCGGYPNIAMNYFCGATTFDSASPNRRVGGGKQLPTNYVFCEEPPKKINNKNGKLEKVKLSKFMLGGFDEHHKLRPEEYRYEDLYTVPDNLSLCDCIACKKANTIKHIKDLYANKHKNPEDYYYARQLIAGHAIFQHQRLCNIVSKYTSMNDFCSENPCELTKILDCIHKQLDNDI